MFYFKGNQASKYKVGNRSRKNGHVRMIYVKILKLKKIQRKLAGKCLFFCRLDESFWQKTSSVIDVKKERAWTALLDGFEKYLAVLLERASLIQETDALKQQVSGERLGTKARGRDGKKPEKIRASTGFEPMTSAIPVRASHRYRGGHRFKSR